MISPSRSHSVDIDTDFLIVAEQKTISAIAFARLRLIYFVTKINDTFLYKFLTSVL